MTSGQGTDHMTRDMKRVSKKFGDVFLGDFLVGGLIISGIFLIVDSLGLDATGKLVLGLIILGAGIGILIYLYLKRLLLAGMMGKLKDEIEPIMALMKIFNALTKDADKSPLSDILRTLLKESGKNIQDFIDDKSE